MSPSRPHDKHFRSMFADAASQLRAFAVVDPIQFRLDHRRT
jgi:hypothetical protein